MDKEKGLFAETNFCITAECLIANHPIFNDLYPNPEISREKQYTD